MRRIASALMEPQVAVIFADRRHDERPFRRWERPMISAPQSRDHAFVFQPRTKSIFGPVFNRF